MGPSRLEIQTVMEQAVVDADTVLERNEQRRAAVVEFLRSQPNFTGTQGSISDMILSDLDSYPAWEFEDGDPIKTRRDKIAAGLGSRYPGRRRP